MRYALFVYEAPGSLDSLGDREKQQVYDEFVAVSETPGIVGHRLQASHMRITLTGGPHPDTARELIGFYILEAEDAARALDVAVRIPTAKLGGAIHVQPLVEEP